MPHLLCLPSVWYRVLAEQHMDQRPIQPSVFCSPIEIAEPLEQEGPAAVPFTSIQPPSARGPHGLPRALAFKIPEQTFLLELIQSLLLPYELWHLQEHIKRAVWGHAVYLVWSVTREFHLLLCLRDTEWSVLLLHFYASHYKLLLGIPSPVTSELWFACNTQLPPFIPRPAMAQVPVLARSTAWAAGARAVLVTARKNTIHWEVLALS